MEERKEKGVAPGKHPRPSAYIVDMLTPKSCHFLSCLERGTERWSLAKSLIIECSEILSDLGIFVF